MAAGKLTTYMIMMGGLTLLFYFGGLLNDCSDVGNNVVGECVSTTPNSNLLNFLLKPENMGDSGTGLALAILTALTVLSGVGIVVGFFAAGNLTQIALASVAIFILNLGWDFLVVFNQVREANSVLAILLFGPVLLVWLLSVIEWWGQL